MNALSARAVTARPDAFRRIVAAATVRHCDILRI
jgi:hypothetical protein